MFHQHPILAHYCICSLGVKWKTGVHSALNFYRNSRDLYDIICSSSRARARDQLTIKTASNSRVNISSIEGTGARERSRLAERPSDMSTTLAVSRHVRSYTRCLSAALWRSQLSVLSYTIPFACPLLPFRKMWASSFTMRAAVSCVLTVCAPVADGARGAANSALAVGTATTSIRMNPVASCPQHIPTVLREGPRSWWVLVSTVSMTCTL